MTKKTRIRLARVTAGAVIAVGASMTAAGAASAAENDDCILGILCTDDPTTPPAEPPTPPETGIPDDPEEPPADPEEPPAEPEEPPAEPEESPAEPEESADPADPADPGDGNDDGNSRGGNNTDPDGGSGNDAVTQEEGSSSLTDTGSEVPTGTTGTSTAQGSGDELAETGAAETTFLLVGAATMIAGGIGFRLLPRLMGGRGGAAA